MDLFILILWFIFNIIIGIMEYPMYTDQVEFSNERNLMIRKIFLPIFKFLMAIPIAMFFTTYEFNNEIAINAFGLYFIGMMFHKGTFFQLRRFNKTDYYRKCFHFFSHSLCFFSFCSMLLGKCGHLTLIQFLNGMGPCNMFRSS